MMAYPTSSGSTFQPTASAEGPLASTSSSVPKPLPAPARRTSARHSGSTGSRPSTALGDENAWPTGFAGTPVGKPALGKAFALTPAGRVGGPGAGAGLGGAGTGALKATAPLRTSSRATNSILARNGNGPNTATRRRILTGSSAAAFKAASAAAATTTTALARPMTAPFITTAGATATASRAMRALSQPSSKASGMPGMGVIRTGPAVVGARLALQRTQPATAPEPRRGIVSAASGLPAPPAAPIATLAVSRTGKRSFEVASEGDTSLSAASPQKRRIIAPASDTTTGPTTAPRPFDLTSPRKATSSGFMASPAKTTDTAIFRISSLSGLLRSPVPQSDRPASLERPKSPVRMLVDEDRVDELMVEREAAVFRPVQAGPEDLHDSSSEDEIDWLSPKKAAPGAGSTLKSAKRTGPSPALSMQVDDAEMDIEPDSPVKQAAVRRSARLSPPTQRKSVGGGGGPALARPGVQRATSVPMALAPRMIAPVTKQTTLSFIPGSPRASSAPPPAVPVSMALAASAASSLLPPPSAVHHEPILSINPALLTQPFSDIFGPRQRSVTPTLLGPATSLVSKRGLSPIPGSPFHASYRSSPAPPTPGKTMRSFIPRPVAVPPTPAVIPPTPAVGLAVASAAATGPGPRGAPGSVTSETAARLEKLQAMLGRLSGPRREGEVADRRNSLTGGGSAAGIQKRSTVVARRPSTAPSALTGANTVTGDSIVSLREPGPDGPPTLAPRSSMPPVAGRPSAAAGRRYSVGMQPPAAASASVTVVAPSGRSTAAITASLAMSGSPTDKDKSHVLRGVVAFVDVRTTAGDDAGMLFVSMLKDLGARVCTRPVPSLTHIVYKSGRPASLARAKQPPAGSPVPFLVGIGWVVQCAERGERVDEAGFRVVEEDPGLAVPLKGKARRSMEPKALASLSSYAGRPRLSGGEAGGAAEGGCAMGAIKESLAKARLRTLAYAPKVGSPLAKRVSGLSLEDLLADKEEGEDVEMD